MMKEQGLQVYIQKLLARTWELKPQEELKLVENQKERA